MSYHGRIMNIQAVTLFKETQDDLSYKVGHKHARHAAAEIANEADALVAELLEALEDMTLLFSVTAPSDVVDGSECRRDALALIDKARSKP